MANTPAHPRRVIMRIELYPDARQGLIDVSDSRGMTQVAATSRVIDWFTSQSDIVQAAILGIYPKDIRDQLPEMILKTMAADK